MSNRMSVCERSLEEIIGFANYDLDMSLVSKINWCRATSSSSTWNPATTNGLLTAASSTSNSTSRVSSPKLYSTRMSCTHELWSTNCCNLRQQSAYLQPGTRLPSDTISIGILSLPVVSLCWFPPPRGPVSLEFQSPEVWAASSSWAPDRQEFRAVRAAENCLFAAQFQEDAQMQVMICLQNSSNQKNDTTLQLDHLFHVKPSSTILSWKKHGLTNTLFWYVCSVCVCVLRICGAGVGMFSGVKCHAGEDSQTNNAHDHSQHLLISSNGEQLLELFKRPVTWSKPRDRALQATRVMVRYFSEKDCWSWTVSWQLGLGMLFSNVFIYNLFIVCSYSVHSLFIFCSYVVICCYLFVRLLSLVHILSLLLVALLSNLSEWMLVVNAETEEWQLCQPTSPGQVPFMQKRLPLTAETLSKICFNWGFNNIH